MFSRFGLRRFRSASRAVCCAQTGQHPRITTEENIAIISRRQLHRMGLGLDNRRSFLAIEPVYMHWTQWIFTRHFLLGITRGCQRADGGVGSARPISEARGCFPLGRQADSWFRRLRLGRFGAKATDDINSTSSVWLIFLSLL